MDLIASWVVYPAVLVAIGLGCGLLVEFITFRPPPRATPSGGGRVRRQTLPTALLPAVGLAGVIVVSQALTLADATAELATPVVVALAVLGIAIGARRRRFPSAPWAIAAAVGVFDYPAAWTELGSANEPIPSGPGTIVAAVEVPSAGTYELWLGGSIRPAVEARIDGEPVGERSHELNNLGGYVSFGSVALDPGAHRVELHFDGAGLAPGSGGQAGPIGPLTLDSGSVAETSLIEVDPDDARARLCGRAWDWIEAVATPVDRGEAGG